MVGLKWAGRVADHARGAISGWRIEEQDIEGRCLARPEDFCFCRVQGSGAERGSQKRELAANPDVLGIPKRIVVLDLADDVEDIELGFEPEREARVNDLDHRRRSRRGQGGQGGGRQRGGGTDEGSRNREREAKYGQRDRAQFPSPSWGGQGGGVRVVPPWPRQAISFWAARTPDKAGWD